MNLEWRVARRYLASRRGTRFLSLITLIAIGGVSVGVTALIVVTAVMNGLQTELRQGILGVNPHIFVLTYGEGMRMDGWEEPLERRRAGWRAWWPRRPSSRRRWGCATAAATRRPPSCAASTLPRRATEVTDIPRHAARDRSRLDRTPQRASRASPWGRRWPSGWGSSPATRSR